MLMLNRGSLMIELLIYIALVAIIVLGAFSWFSRSERSLLKLGAASNMLMALYSATDLLVRDVRLSPKNRNAWFCLDSQTIIWHGDANDIGWYVDKRTLYRIEGTYDQMQGTWRNKKRSIALQNIENGLFHVVQLHETIDHVDITLMVQTGGMRHTVHECIYLSENRV